MNTLLTAAQENSDVDLMQNAVNVVEGTLWGAGIGVLCLGICFALDKLFTSFGGNSSFPLVGKEELPP